LIPITIVIIGAGAFMHLRRGRDRGLTSEPISGQWLAERRGREEQPW
jgi:hypothetical protein